MGGSGPLSILPNLAARLPYDPLKDFVPIVLVGTWANLLVVHPSVPAASLKKLIALAKSKPGTLSYASQGNGVPPASKANRRAFSFDRPAGSFGRAELRSRNRSEL